MLIGMFICLFPIILYKPEEWRFLIPLSIILSICLDFWIWWRDISPDILEKSLIQGNGYMLFM